MRSIDLEEHPQAQPAAPEYGLETLGEFGPTSVSVPVVRAQKYSFDGRGGGGDEVVVLADGIDASWWVSGALHVILHSKNDWLTGAGAATTGSLAVEVIPVRLAEDSPDTTYVSAGGGAGGGAVASATISAASTSKTYQVAALSGAFGPSLRVQLRFTQGALAAGSPQTATLTVELLGRASGP